MSTPFTPLLRSLPLLLCTLPVAAQGWTVEPPLPVARSFFGTAATGGVAYFAGGRDAGGVVRADIDTYDSSTGTWAGGALPFARSSLTAVAAGGRVLFAGGVDGSCTLRADVEIYDPSIGPLSNPAAWSSTTLPGGPVRQLSSIAIGPYAMFTGGEYSPCGTPGGVQSTRVDIYDTGSGTWSTASLSQARTSLAIAAVGNYVLIGGGWSAGGVFYDTVDIYDLTAGAPDDPAAWSTHTLSVARRLLAATTVGTKVLFGGGSDGLTVGGMSDAVDIYDSAVGAPNDPAAWSTSSLSVGRNALAACSVGDLAIFAGGWSFNYTIAWHSSAAVDIYDATTGTWTQALLSDARNHLAAISVGDVALIAGGRDGPTQFDTVDRFEPVAASATPRNGSGINPMTLSSTTLPQLGTSWELALDCSANSPSIAVLAISFAALPGVPLAFGELLIDPTGAFLQFDLHQSGVETFSLALPNTYSLEGVELFAQGLVFGAPAEQLSNAIDGVIGR